MGIINIIGSNIIRNFKKNFSPSDVQNKILILVLKIRWSLLIELVNNYNTLHIFHIINNLWIIIKGINMYVLGYESYAHNKNRDILLIKIFRKDVDVCV